LPIFAGRLGGVEPVAPVPEASTQAADGDRAVADAVALYRRYCLRCHERDGRGSRTRERLKRIPDFTSVAWQEKHTEAELAVYILEGRGTQMPAFSDRLSQTEARDLAAYVRALDPPADKAGSAPRPRVSQPKDDDFDKRFRELQKELKELRRQFREAARRLEETTSRAR
jgi:mono/diheme cytochrome c family protein